MEALIDQGDRDQALELAFTQMVRMPAEAVAALRHTPMWPEWMARPTRGHGRCVQRPACPATCASSPQG